MLTVIGEALIDLVSTGGPHFRAIPGGSPLNVAIGLARLGQPVSLRARIGTDAFGRTLRDHVERNGLDLARVVDATEPITLAVVGLDQAGRADYSFYVDGTADWQWTESELAQYDPATTVLHTGSLATWLSPGAERLRLLVSGLHATGEVLLTYDPNVRPALLGSPQRGRDLIEPWLRTSHVVKASDDDLAWLYPGEEPVEVANRWLAAGPGLVVVTLGGQGAVAVFTRPDGTAGVVWRPAPQITLVDTVGAGDAFMSGLLDALVNAAIMSPDVARTFEPDTVTTLLDRAVRVSALTCERAGADPPTAAEIEQLG